MMKLRPLMVNETSGEFHMVKTKGDSVCVSGFSFVGSEDQMREVRAEHGDAMIHHVVTVSGDTTQGGLEGYAAIFAQLQRVKRFVTNTLLTLTLIVTHSDSTTRGLLPMPRKSILFLTRDLGSGLLLAPSAYSGLASSKYCPMV